MSTRVEKQRQHEKWFLTYIDRFSTKALTIISLHVSFSVMIVMIDGLDYRAKISLFAFLSAMTFWIGVKIPAGLTAILLLVFIIIMKAGETEILYNSLSEEVVWLMIGSFIIGEAVKQSGLSERFSRLVVEKSKNKNNIIIGLVSALFTTAFFIPSTSGRAALSMPIIKELGLYFNSKEKKVLALMIPVIILMTTSATLIGAGSHLIGIGLLKSTTNLTISYIQWLIWGVPFTLVITLISVIIIKWRLWPKNAGEEIISKNTTDTTNTPINDSEKKTLILLVLLMIGWITEGLHGYDLAFVTMFGAIVFMLPKYGVIDWKSGMKSVSWNLIIFVAAATALGKVLVETGVVVWIENELMNALQLFVDAPEWLIILIILFLTATSHLYITSHTTRAIVFIPSLILFSKTIGANPETVVFLSLIGMNYCVTFPVSSKALLLFYEEEEVSFDSVHLFKISAILMPIYILIAAAFYFTYWEWTGMHL
ncbi:citrate:succinate antiporter [Siminovitchia acidinfaciens]|uniref:Citrate:succinate antiporter n=1 Tax=Siminovitchia acidinfaciens TaxID=2321395 RepID=A0A429XVH4_9BACI|nr:SLC13 family permease [Siminovitchia acidinfaciens]RST72262.1 citrate:succinate antiporter [Siminovitchia acidinfaciens]